MNKRNVQWFPVAMTLVVMAGFSQAADLNLNTRRGMGGELQDGVIIATGRIICREAHTKFHVWINAHEDKERPGHYLVRGNRDRRNEIRIRVGGKGWTPVPGVHQGVERPGTGDQARFYLAADGMQHVAPDEYVFSVTGTCYNSGQQK